MKKKKITTCCLIASEWKCGVSPLPAYPFQERADNVSHARC